MFEVMLIIYTLYTIAKIYISVMEAKFVASKKDGKAIVLSEKKFKEAGEYKIETSKISIVSSMYDLLMFFAWIGFGFKALDSVISFDNSMLYTVSFILAFSAVNFVLGLPFDLYQTFNLDKRYGFSTIDVKTYVIDQIKGAVMFLVFGSLLILLLAFIIVSFESWWIYGFGAVFILILFINMIYPTLIAPIFNKFSPLDNEELQSAI
ncbi:MAG TPA: M48 family peptidase, partial [Sulfurospirillum arcachonense]|nr:M48 family peptidase [Sulfurospirillum arcachonense]